ncbi:MAG TPA: carboxypeptidase regulatory-like domain-containing protein [Bryocella sp.]|nr:carboxypeptidase regulatory-like domain-containing protein [Bryocella sp.]
MTTPPQSEPHLDADQLAAFAEGALPAAERALCLRHLAECAHCREVAFLAGAALPEDEPAIAPARRFSFPWWPVLSLGGAAIAAVVIAVVILHQAHQSKPSTQIQMAARSSVIPTTPLAATAPIDRPAPAQPNPRVLPKPSPAQKQVPKSQTDALKESQAMDATMTASAAPAVPGAGAVAAAPLQAANKAAPKGASNFSLAPPTAAPPQSQSPRLVAGAGQAVAKAAPSATLHAYSQAYMRSAGAPPGIMGTITDSSGAMIPHAKVTLDQASGTAHRETFTDSAGRFTISSLQPGKYRMEISAPGFMSQVREVEVGTTQLAEVDSKLAAGAVSETVEVRAATPALDTESASASSSVLSILPAKEPLKTSVTNGTRTLALDTAGKLFLSKKPGKPWKAVRGPWRKSAVTSLALTPDQSFKVTSAQGSWLSADGQHWSSTN